MKLLNELYYFPDLLIRKNRYFQLGHKEVSENRILIDSIEVSRIKNGLIIDKDGIRILILRHQELGLVISTFTNGIINQRKVPKKDYIDDLSQWMIFLMENQDMNLIESKMMVNNLTLLHEKMDSGTIIMNERIKYISSVLDRCNTEVKIRLDSDLISLLNNKFLLIEYLEDRLIINYSCLDSHPVIMKYRRPSREEWETFLPNMSSLDDLLNFLSVYNV